MEEFELLYFHFAAAGIVQLPIWHEDRFIRELRLTTGNCTISPLNVTASSLLTGTPNPAVTMYASQTGNAMFFGSEVKIKIPRDETRYIATDVATNVVLVVSYLTA